MKVEGNTNLEDEVSMSRKRLKDRNSKMVYIYVIVEKETEIGK